MNLPQNNINFVFLITLVDADNKDYPVFDEKNVRNYPYQFGEMAREILDS